ncbi:MAG: O-antigen ligase [Candidatus Aldehydirespiratoraceae bacterium]|jgi:O-antigen ligase
MQADREVKWYSAAAVVSPALFVLAPGFLVIAAVAVVVAGRLTRGGSRCTVPRLASNDLMVMGVAFALAAVWSAVAGSGGFEAVGMVLRFSLVPIGFAVVRGSARVDLRHSIWLGAVIGAVAAGTASVLLLLITEMARPTSYANPIHFGEMALVLGFVAAATRGIATGNPKRIDRLTLVAVGAALTAGLLSHARGGWIALPAIILVTAVHHVRSPDSRRLRYVFALSLALVPVLGLAATANNRAALNAFDRGISQTVEYVVNHGDADTGETSVGARLEMWRSAFEGFRREPALGIGWGNMDDRFQEDVDAGVRAERIAEHSHPHNQYLSHLGSGGIVGLGTFLALLGVPGWICGRALMRRRGDAQALGGAGLVVIVGYATFSLTDSVFETASPLVFFVAAVGTIVAQIDRVESEQVFVYPSIDGMEQPQRLVEGHRTDAL